MTRNRIAIGVCSFRRPQLIETLESLERQVLPAGTRVTIFVADNDETPSAAGLVAEAAQRFDTELVYLHCPARNISVARNGVLNAVAAAGIEMLAFIDDDERAAPDWLAGLLRRIEQGGAEAVLGPVAAAYAPEAPGWMRKSKVHDTRPELDAAGHARSGYTCNVLLDLSAPAFAGRRFDLGRGRSGGEDTAYFKAAMDQGARIVCAPDAVLSEDVPADRAKLGWLLRRRFRMGQTHASLISVGASGPTRARQAAIAGLKVSACAGLALLRLPVTDRRNLALMRGALHLGTVSGLLGLRPLILYGRSDDARRSSRDDTSPAGSKT